MQSLRLPLSVEIQATSVIPTSLALIATEICQTLENIVVTKERNRVFLKGYWEPHISAACVLIRMQIQDVSVGKTEVDCMAGECSTVQVTAVVPEQTIGHVMQVLTDNRVFVQSMADQNSGKAIIFNIELLSIGVVRNLVAEIEARGEILQVEHLGFGPTSGGTENGCA